DQEHGVVLDDRQRPRAWRNLRIGTEQRKVGEAAVEQRQRLGIVSTGYNLEAKTGGGVLHDRREPLSEMRLLAVGGADGEDQGFRALHPGAAGPDRESGEDQRQQREQHHLAAVGDGKLRSLRLLRLGWDLSAHGLSRRPDLLPLEARCGPRNANCLKKNGYF